MTRSRTLASAKQAGTRFETETAQVLGVERRAKTGAKDTGDIGPLHTHDGTPIVVECKNTARPDLSGWAKQGEREAHNYRPGSLWVIIHKRHGVGDPEKQWVTMTVETLHKLVRKQNNR